MEKQCYISVRPGFDSCIWVIETCVTRKKKNTMNKPNIFSELNQYKNVCPMQLLHYCIKCSLLGSKHNTCFPEEGHKRFQFLFILLSLTCPQSYKKNNKINHMMWQLTKGSFRLRDIPRIGSKWSKPCVMLPE